MVDAVKFSKPALDVSAQIELLKQRGMSFPDMERALRALSHVNYYRLRAYWLPYEQVGGAADVHKFQPSTSFDEVFSLYVFDRDLRLLLLEAIERVEIAVRTHWAQVLAEKYGSHAYLDPILFNKQDIHQSCLNSLDEELGRSKETFVKHYMAKYSDPSRPPIWAISELLTLGQLSKWLGNTKLRSDRQGVASRLKMDEVVVCKFAHHLTHVRNICAHHGRIWNRKLTLTMTIPSRPSELSVQFNKAEDRRIFNTLVMLCWCIKQINPGTTWPARLKTLLESRSEAQLSAMGAMRGWSSRAPWT